MGLYYFGSRYFDPVVIMWTSQDPMKEFYNSYSYCGSNPIILIDPNGLKTEQEITDLAEKVIEETKTKDPNTTPKTDAVLLQIVDKIQKEVTNTGSKDVTTGKDVVAGLTNAGLDPNKSELSLSEVSKIVTEKNGSKTENSVSFKEGFNGMTKTKTDIKGKTRGLQIDKTGIVLQAANFKDYNIGFVPSGIKGNVNPSGVKLTGNFYLGLDRIGLSTQGNLMGTVKVFGAPVNIEFPLK